MSELTLSLANAKARPAQAAGKDPARPVLMHGQVRRTDDGFRVEASNSFIAASVPLAQDPLEDVPGELAPVMVPRGALDALGKGHRLALNGSVETVDPRTGARTRWEPGEGRFPQIDALWPSGEAEMTVAFNARFLWQLAQALGSDEVVMEVRGPLRPFTVRPLKDSQAAGLISPIRIPA